MRGEAVGGNRRKKKRASGGFLAEQMGFLAEGLGTVLGWVGTLFASIAALFAWIARRTWEGVSGDQGRQAIGMVLAAVMVFVFVAMLDYEAGAPERNVCGQFGHGIADLALTRLGIAAFILPFFACFWGLAAAFRNGVSGVPVKAAGVVALTLVVSIAAYGVAPAADGTPGLPTGRGGTFGPAAFGPLQDSLGPFGLAVLLTLVGALALLLASEWAFVPLVRDMLARAGKGLRQPELPLKARKRGLKEERESATRGASRLWQSLLGLVSPFRPAEERAEDAAAAARGAKSKPARRKAAPVVEDDEEYDEYEEEPDEDAEEDDEEYDEEYDEDEEYEEDEEEDEDDAEYDEDEEWEEEEDEEPARLVSLPRIASEEPPLRPKKQRQPTLGSLPPPTILKPGERRDRAAVQSEIDSLGRRLQAVFDAFGLDARVVGAERGPTLTLFEVQLAQGVSVKKLKNQRDDLEVALGSHGVRIVYPLPGRSTVGVEVPNLKREMVRMKDVFEEVDVAWETNKLPMILGRDTLGKPAFEDLSVMPHMLVAGTTGSGKSVCLNGILCSWLLTRTPDQLRLVLIDPKQVELQLYRDIPHLLCPVVTDMKRAPFTLEWATRQMEDRLHLFKLAGVRNITDYNALGEKELKERLAENWDPDEYQVNLPFIVLVIDELADLMLVSAKEVEVAISRLAAKARAAGIHLLVATQRPSTDVVTGLIKMNLPVRLAFKVTSAVDSRVILDESGADDLLGNGDFLYRPPGAAGMIRGQGAFVSEREVREICDHLRKHGKPEFLEDLVQMKGPASDGGAIDDPLFDDAVRIILQSGRGSASLLQRALSIGYTRASRLIDIMTEQGILGPFTGSKARDVLMTLEDWDAHSKQPQ
ncbi:MAG TPA: DNA translocase FtsK 4TM domain-containing protein [Planctomycetota bacterium]